MTSSAREAPDSFAGVTCRGSKRSVDWNAIYRAKLRSELRDHLIKFPRSPIEETAFLAVLTIVNDALHREDDIAHVLSQHCSTFLDIELRSVLDGLRVFQCHCVMWGIELLNQYLTADLSEDRYGSAQIAWISLVELSSALIDEFRSRALS